MSAAPANAPEVDDTEGDTDDDTREDSSPFVVLPGLGEQGEASADPSDYQPPGFDLFTRDPATLRGQLEREVDPTIVAVRIYRGPLGRGGNVGPLCGGPYDAATVNRESVLRYFGPGIYVAWCVNGKGHIVAKKSFSVGEGARASTLQPFPGSERAQRMESGGATGGSSRIAELKEVLELARMLNPPQQNDPLREAVASITQLIALQTQQLSVQMKTQQAAGAPAQALTDKLFALLLDERRAPKESGAAVTSQNFMELLRFGMALGGAGGKGPAAPDQWVELVGSAVETVGPSAIMAIAGGLLPPEKFEQFSEIMAQHMKAREAEAKQQPIDTTGESSS